jgi:hypothetical protein
MHSLPDAKTKAQMLHDRAVETMAKLGVALSAENYMVW